MYYLGDTDLTDAFSFIYNQFQWEQAPPYESEEEGMEIMRGVVEKMHFSYYETVHDKAAYLFLEVVSGHPFSNGNKRLALVLTLVFFLYNYYAFDATKDKHGYANELQRAFPEIESWDDFDEFSGIDFALYNVAGLVARHHEEGIASSVMRERLGSFFRDVFIYTPNLDHLS